MGISFDSHDLPRIADYLNLLMEHNQRMNLTAIRDMDTAWSRHILDSLTLLPYLVEFGAKTAADLGSGGGLPGIPLAICLPDIQFTLIEATGKKARFLSIVVDKLKLHNVLVINERAETLGQATIGTPNLRNHFDVVLTRAVGKLVVILELAIPLLKTGGYFIAVKGDKADQELAEAHKALHILKSEHIDTILTKTGRLVIIHKNANTPSQYPRRPGEPGRLPLK